MDLKLIKKMGALGCVVVASGGCSWRVDYNGVQDLDIYENPSESHALQLNHHHKSGRSATQLEIQQVNIDDQIKVSPKFAENGYGEARIRNTELPDKPEYQMVGVGEVAASYEIRQSSLRHVFKLDAGGRIQIDLATELSLLQLDSEYRSDRKALDIDMDKSGAGLSFTFRWQLFKALSFNFSGTHTYYDGGTDTSNSMVYLRVYPVDHFFIDLGRQANYFDFGDDTHVSYEYRVPEAGHCHPSCQYVYDGTRNSNLVVENIGYRVAIGYDF